MKVNFYLSGLMAVTEVELTNGSKQLTCLLLNASNDEIIRNRTKRNILGIHRPSLICRNENYGSTVDPQFIPDVSGNPNLFWDLTDCDVTIGIDPGEQNKESFGVEINSHLPHSGDYPMFPGQVINGREASYTNDPYWMGLVPVKETIENEGDQEERRESKVSFGEVRPFLLEDLDHFPRSIVSRVTFNTGTLVIDNFVVDNNENFRFLEIGGHVQAISSIPYVQVELDDVFIGRRRLYVDEDNKPNRFDIERLELVVDDSTTSDNGIIEVCISNMEDLETLRNCVNLDKREIDQRLREEFLFFNSIIQNGEVFKDASAISCRQTYLRELNLCKYINNVDLPFYKPYKAWLNPQQDGESPPCSVVCRPRYCPNNKSY